MKMLIIVTRSSMVSTVEEFLLDIGINAYSLLNKVEGKGATGKVPGPFTMYSDVNTMIFAVVPSDQVDRSVSAFKAFHAERVKATHGQPVPFKLFSSPCEEII
jgi:nitrogen regulatory protein PII